MFSQAHAFPLSEVSCVMYIPSACKSGNASCQSNQRSYLLLQVFGGGYFSQPHLVNFKRNSWYLNLVGFFFSATSGRRIRDSWTKWIRDSSDLSQLCQWLWLSKIALSFEWLASSGVKQVLGHSYLSMAIVICTGKTAGIIEMHKEHNSDPKDP